MDSDQDQNQDEEVMEQNIDPSELQIPSETVKLDIFQHMRIGIKNKDVNCLCENDLESLYYCIPCKVSCCPKCSLQDHYTHLLLQKEKYTLKPPQIEHSFGSVENMLEKDDLYQNIQEKRKELINEIDMTYQRIIALADEWKQKKYKEINDLFDELTENIQDLNSKKKRCKENIK